MEAAGPQVSVTGSQSSTVVRVWPAGPNPPQASTLPDFSVTAACLRRAVERSPVLWNMSELRR